MTEPLNAQTLARAMRERFGLAYGARVVVGASGGLDSTVLLRLLHEAGFAAAVAHVNYGLRGEASDGDEAFVQGLAEGLGVPCHVHRVALPEGENRQEAAREARYAFFEEAAEAEGAEVVAVAHHQDDQAETVLLHLLRGTGPRGLAGMPAARPIRRGSAVRLIRPLLGWPRAELETVARARGWAWREDASNRRVRYRRNWLRRRVMPELEATLGPGVAARIAETADRVRTLLEAVPAPPRRLPVAALQELPEAERHARYLDALRRWAPEAPRRANAVAELDALLAAQPGRRVVWPGATVWRDRDALVFEAGEGEASEEEAWPVPVGAPVTTPSGTLTVSALDEVPERLPASLHEEVADADALTGPLVLRRWRAGDRFRPLGLGGTKRVSDLLTEVKVPPSERRRQLVLCAGTDIVWVVGRRLAEAARVTPETRRVVRLAWKPAPPGRRGFRALTDSGR